MVLLSSNYKPFEGKFGIALSHKISLPKFDYTNWLKIPQALRTS